MKRPCLGLHPQQRCPDQGLPDLEYPFHDTVTSSSPPAGVSLHTTERKSTSPPSSPTAAGIKEVDEGIWLVSFIDYDLGYIDLEQRTLQPVDNPFGPKLSPMS